MNTTGRRLRRIRKLHGVTSTAELAALCRVDVSTLWRWTVAGEKPRGNNEARLAELEAHPPAPPAQLVDPPTDSRGACSE